MSRRSRLLVAALLLAGVGTVLVVTRITGTDATEQGALPEPTVFLSATARVVRPEAEIPSDSPAGGDTSQLLPPEAVVVPTSGPTGEPGAADLITVTERAVLAWQSPDDQTRTKALRTLATTEYQEIAATIDATRVPSAHPERVLLRNEADGQALVDVQLEDGTRLAAILMLEQDQWLLADLQPVPDSDALDVS
ncbi:hypothetical protein [Jannaschia sp. R86511]|uniref:hypothetical protein n=1 Tax=Jannaschia sp. R86511 TaxID=3093853 RepID=UPI0036D410BA